MMNITKLQSMKYPATGGGFKTWDQLTQDQQQGVIAEQQQRGQQGLPQNQQPDKVLNKIQGLRFPATGGGFKTWNQLTPEQQEEVYEETAIDMGVRTTGFSGAVGSSVDRLQGGLQYAGGELAKRWGFEDKGEEWQRAGLRNLDESNKYVPEVASYKDVDDLSSAADYVEGLAGNALPYLLTMPAYSNPWTGAAMLSASAVAETGANAYEQQKLKGGVDWGVATGYGAGQAMIERFMPGFRQAKGMLGKTVGRGVDSAVSSVARPLVGDASARVAGQVTGDAITKGTAGLITGGVESQLQNAWSNATLGRDLTENWDEALVASTAMGAPMQAVRGAFGRDPAVADAFIRDREAAQARMDEKLRDQADLETVIRDKQSRGEDVTLENHSLQSLKMEINDLSQRRSRGARFDDKDDADVQAAETVRGLEEHVLTKEAEYKKEVSRLRRTGLTKEAAESRANQTLGGELRTVRRDASEAREAYANQHRVKNSLENSLGALRLIQESGGNVGMETLRQKVQVPTGKRDSNGNPIYKEMTLAKALGASRGSGKISELSSKLASFLPGPLSALGGSSNKSEALRNIVTKFNTNFDTYVNSLDTAGNLSEANRLKLERKLRGVKGDLVKYMNGSSDTLSASTLQILGSLEVGTPVKNLTGAKGPEGESVTRGREDQTSILSQVEEVRAARKMLGEVDDGKGIFNDVMLSAAGGVMSGGLTIAAQGFAGAIGALGNKLSRNKVSRLLDEYDAQSSLLGDEKLRSLRPDERGPFKKKAIQLRDKMLSAKNQTELMKYFKQYNKLMMPSIMPEQEDRQYSTEEIQQLESETTKKPVLRGALSGS